MSENISNNIEIKPLKTSFYNCIKNEYDSYTEIVYYKKPFQVTTGNCKGIDFQTGELLLKNSNIDRTRKFILNENGVLVPKDEETIIKIQDMQNSINNSRSRSLDAIYGYVMSNDWDYFITLTFDKNKIDRDNEEAIKYSWQLFRQKLQYIEKDVKVFAIPERHKKGQLHLHCLVGNIDLEKYLTLAKNPKTNQYIKKNGRYVYNITLFKQGFSTCVKTDSNRMIIANYLTKYMIKDFGTIGYNKKSYFNTRNLNFKNKEYAFLEDFDESIITDMINDKNFCKIYKETDNMIVYRYTLPFQK